MRVCLSRTRVDNKETAWAGDDAVAGTQAFISRVTEGITHSNAFLSLSAAQQAEAASQIALMRHQLENSLDEIRATRGSGALVTGEDIRQILPNLVGGANAH